VALLREISALNPYAAHCFVDADLLAKFDIVTAAEALVFEDEDNVTILFDDDKRFGFRRGWRLDVK
jgi:hypothetical protein